MTVSDLVAPVFKSVEDWRIPETWGKTVYKRGEDGKEEATQLGNKIHFTVPEVVDNDPESPVTVYFRITDSDNSKTVIEFTNILADDNDSASKYVASDKSSYKADATFSTENGFDFNFNDYRKVDPKDPDKSLDLAGTYTVLYLRAIRQTTRPPRRLPSSCRKNTRTRRNRPLRKSPRPTIFPIKTKP